MTPSVPVVRLAGVSKLYESRRERLPASTDLTLEARAGEMVLFLGPSGSGKTTLLTLAAGLLEPSAGTVELFGKDLRSLPEAGRQRLRGLHMGFVFQTFRLIDCLTVEENVALVRRLAPKRHPEPGQNGSGLLEKLGIGHLRRAFPPTLSQGEKQRVAIARALVNDPELIIADEPTASLSTEDSVEAIRLLQGAASTQGRCVLVATHDLRLTEYADRVIHLQDGRIGQACPQPAMDS